MLDVEQCERSDRLLREFSPENVLYRGEAFKGGPAGQLLHGIIDLYDSDGQSIKEPINDLIASLTLDNQSLQSNVNLIKQPNGSIQVRYMARKSGNWTLAVTDTTNQHIRGSPFSVEIVPANTSPNYSTLHYIKQHNYISNYKEFVVQLRDIFSNNSLSGTEGLSVYITGSGKVINVLDLHNGTYRIICYINESHPLSLLNVKLFGKDVVNSPFNLTTLYHPKTQRENTPVDILRDCKLVLQENKRINTQLHAQLASYQRMRDEVEISYTAARLGVVHSIPAAFTITEPDPLEREKRAKLVQQYNEMNAEISEIQEKLTNLQEEKRELFDYLHNKYKNSKDYYKEIVDEYNFIIGNVVKLNKLLKTDQWMRRHMTDADVMKKFNEMAKVNQSLKLLQESNNTINASETTVDAGSVNSKNVLEEGTHSTVPDKPNTLAFWLVEGKFRT